MRLSLEKTAMTWCFFVELKNIFDKLGGKTDQASILGLETFEIMLKIVDLLSVKNYQLLINEIIIELTQQKTKEPKYQ